MVVVVVDVQNPQSFYDVVVFSLFFDTFDVFIAIAAAAAAATVVPASNYHPLCRTQRHIEM